MHNKKCIALLTALIHLIVFGIVAEYSDIADNELAYNLYITMISYTCIAFGLIRLKHEQIQLNLIIYFCCFSLCMQVVAMIYIF